MQMDGCDTHMDGCENDDGVGEEHTGSGGNARGKQQAQVAAHNTGVHTAAVRAQHRLAHQQGVTDEAACPETAAAAMRPPLHTSTRPHALSHHPHTADPSPSEAPSSHPSSVAHTHAGTAHMHAGMVYTHSTGAGGSSSVGLASAYMSTRGLNTAHMSSGMNGWGTGSSAGLGSGLKRPRRLFESDCKPPPASGSAGSKGQSGSGWGKGRGCGEEGGASDVMEESPGDDSIVGGMRWKRRLILGSHEQLKGGR